MVHARDKDGTGALSPTLEEKIDCVHLAIVIPPHSASDRV